MAYLDRYAVFSEVQWQVYAGHPQLVMARATVKEELRKLLKVCLCLF